MKIVCTQENLKNGLQIVGRIVGSSNTLPILNNVLLKTEEGLLKLIGTNLELAVSTMVRCKIENEGSVSVHAKTLADLVNNMPNTNITIETAGSEIQLSTAQYSAKLKTLPSDDFPLIPVIDTSAVIECPAIVLRDGLDVVSFATSTSESQPEISGVLFEPVTTGIKLVATDRYRLAEKIIALDSKSLSKGVIIPHRTAIELSRLLANYTDLITAAVTENQIAVTIGDSQLISRLIDGQHPEYTQIIPESFNATILIQKQAFASALKTSGIFSRGTGSVTFSFDVEKQAAVISSTSPDIGDSVAELPAEVTGENGSVMLNYRYVLDVLNVTTAENITVKVVNEDAPVIFIPQGDKTYMYLVMPIKG